MRAEAVIASDAKQSMVATKKDRIASLTLGMTRASARPQRVGAVADHFRLPRQRDRGRGQDHQRLGAEDCSRQIKAGLGAIKPADDGPERGTERARAIAH